jgi:uncharacterized protein (TIGR02145 family)
MKKLFIITAMLISPILSQCDWNGDYNGDCELDVIDIVGTVYEILDGTWVPPCCGCTDPAALNYNPDATIDDGSCVYDNSCGVCIDIEGNSYGTLLLGNQCWMAENLKVTHYNNGDSVPTGFTDSEWVNLDQTETGAYAVYPWDEDNYSLNTCNGDCSQVYGNLYNWYAVDDNRGVCPVGWHMPTDDEWIELEMFLGMSYTEAHDTGWRGNDEGSQLAGNALFWWDGGLENDPVFGSSGFVALPGGYRAWTGTYNHPMGGYGAFWSSTASNIDNAWFRLLAWHTREVARNNIGYPNQTGFSIRCVMD